MAVYKVKLVSNRRATICRSEGEELLLNRPAAQGLHWRSLATPALMTPLSTSQTIPPGIPVQPVILCGGSGSPHHSSRPLVHRKVHRPWGWYDNIDEADRFKVKPKASLSLQMHHHRAEYLIVVNGTAEITNGDKTILLCENQSTYIPLGEAHLLANPGTIPLEIIAVQSGGISG